LAETGELLLQAVDISAAIAMTATATAALPLDNEVGYFLSMLFIELINIPGMNNTPCWFNVDRIN
jgi:hypothetical protein